MSGTHDVQGRVPAYPSATARRNIYAFLKLILKASGPTTRTPSQVVREALGLTGIQRNIAEAAVSSKVEGTTFLGAISAELTAGRLVSESLETVLRNGMSQDESNIIIISTDAERRWCETNECEQARLVLLDVFDLLLQTRF